MRSPDAAGGPRPWVVVLAEGATGDAGIPNRLRMDVRALLDAGERVAVIALDADGLRDDPALADGPGHDHLAGLPIAVPFELVARAALACCARAGARAAYQAVEELAYWRGLRREARRALERFARAHPVGRVIAHDAAFALAAAPLCRARGVPLGYVVHALVAERVRGRTSPHGALLTAARRAGERTAMRAATRTFPVSRSTAAVCIAEGAPRERVEVVHNLVDTRALGAPRPLAARDVDCLFVGRLAPEKGIDVLLEAAERLPAGRHVTVVGYGPLAPHVERAAERMPGRLAYLGRRSRPEVLDLCGRARVVLVPSRSEPFGFVVLEAFRGATPVVASAVGGLAEIVRAGRDGVLVAPGDAAALVRGVEEVTGDARRWHALSAAARARLDDFAFPARAGEILRAYAFDGAAAADGEGAAARADAGHDAGRPHPTAPR